MTGLERIRAVKRSARGALLGLPGVLAIAISTKIIAGQRTEQLAIAVFVSKKKPRSALSADEVVPTVIAGLPTDVIEMDLPHTAVAGAPTAPQLTATPSGLSAIELTGNDVPGSGYVVTAAISTTSDGGPSNPYVISLETVNGDTVAAIGSRFADAIQEQTSVPATYDASSSQVVLTPAAGMTASVSSASAIIDDSASYTPLVGGVQVRCRPVNVYGSGTLGCMLVDASTPPQVYALTNYHVVANWGHAPTPGALILAPVVLTSQSAPGQATDVSFITIGASGRLATTVTTLTLTLSTPSSSQPPFEILSVYTPSTPPAATDVDDAATAVQVAINHAMGTDVTATLAGGVLTIAPNDPLKLTTLVVTASSSNGDPTMLRQDLLSNLSATANGTTVTLAGFVNSDSYGVYTILHVGGRVPTYGTFTPLQNGRALADVANDVVLSINQLTADIKNLYGVDVSAAPITTGFTVSGVVLVECNVSQDVHASQPASFLGLGRGYIGKVVAARYDADVALIQLKPGIAYDARVVNINHNLAGRAEPTLNQSVKKRGRTTDVTYGKVTSIDRDGPIGGHDDASIPHVLFGAIEVTGSPTGPFVLPGDSGSVILVNGGVDDNKVVGLLVGGDPSGSTAIAVPIDQVFQALLPRFLQVALQDGAAPPASAGP